VRSAEKLEKQCSYCVYQGYGKDSFGCFIPLAIDVKSKENDVQQQTGNREGSDQLFVALQRMKKITEAIEAEFPEIITIKTEYRNDQPQKNAVDKIVFFQDFHV
jgi:uncharacterized protein (UPF0305 family)